MEINRKLIYLDYNATTRLDSRVLEAMMPYLTNEFANAGSTHKFGVVANNAVKSARKHVAAVIGAQEREITFTSGATEAINLAIKGVMESYHNKPRHVITLCTEHPAVLDTCRYIRLHGCEVTYLSVKPDGLIDLDELKRALRRETIMVIVMIVNNETGVIQPIKEIADIAHRAGALFMSDATQAVGKININVDELGIDLLCMSAHKIYGPKGVGALYVRQRKNRIQITPLLHGGGHEKGIRSGTLNVPGIIGFGFACQFALIEMDFNAHHILMLRNRLESRLLEIEDTSINGNIIDRLYNTTNILFTGADSDAIIMALSDQESVPVPIAVSNGSACTSSSVQPSHVLTAMGLSEIQSFSSIRFSLGKYNDIEEIDLAIQTIGSIVSDLRKMAL